MSDGSQEPVPVDVGSVFEVAAKRNRVAKVLVRWLDGLGGVEGTDDDGSISLGEMARQIRQLLISGEIYVAYRESNEGEAEPKIWVRKIRVRTKNNRTPRWLVGLVIDESADGVGEFGIDEEVALRKLFQAHGEIGVEEPRFDPKEQKALKIEGLVFTRFPDYLEGVDG